MDVVRQDVRARVVEPRWCRHMWLRGRQAGNTGARVERLAEAPWSVIGAEQMAETIRENRLERSRSRGHSAEVRPQFSAQRGHVGGRQRGRARALLPQGGGSRGEEVQGRGGGGSEQGASRPAR